MPSNILSIDRHLRLPFIVQLTARAIHQPIRLSPESGVSATFWVLAVRGQAKDVQSAQGSDRPTKAFAWLEKRLVEHLERAGFVVMQRAPIGGGAAAIFRRCDFRASRQRR